MLQRVATSTENVVPNVTCNALVCVRVTVEEQPTYLIEVVQSLM